MKTPLCTLTIILLACICEPGVAQDSSSFYNKVFSFPNKLFSKMDQKSAAINAKLEKQAEKYLQRIIKQEQKLQKQLAKKDSLAAKQIFGNATEQYAELQQKIQNLSFTKRRRGKYIGHLDSLQTALKFLSTEKLVAHTGQLTSSLNKIADLQTQFNKTEEISKFLQQRKQYLQEQLSQYGLGRPLDKLKKEVYYYQAKANELKATFEDPSKLEAKAMELLSNTPAFKDFFSKNSQLAALFPMQGSAAIDNATGTIASLQTRAAVQQQIIDRFGSSSVAQQAMQSGVQNAQAQLNGLKNKINQYLGGNGSGDVSMPDFKLNNMRTKTFWKRLEPGFNLQSKGSNQLLPSTADVAASLGYKLSEKKTIGVAVSYKIGLGQPLRTIHFSSQGVGLRSYADIQISKMNWWISGGYELNYLQEFKDLPDISEWQKSALIGVMKKYKIGKKKGTLQLLFDVLHAQHVPKGQAIVFRTGYQL